MAIIARCLNLDPHPGEILTFTVNAPNGLHYEFTDIIKALIERIESLEARCG